MNPDLDSRVRNWRLAPSPPNIGLFFINLLFLLCSSSSAVNFSSPPFLLLIILSSPPPSPPSSSLVVSLHCKARKANNKAMFFMHALVSFGRNFRACKLV